MAMKAASSSPPPAGSPTSGPCSPLMAMDMESLHLLRVWLILLMLFQLSAPFLEKG
jgi:hypothetical protein